MEFLHAFGVGGMDADFRYLPVLSRLEQAMDAKLCRRTPKGIELTDVGQVLLTQVRRLLQITGVEGYVESAAMGLLAGRFAAAAIHGRELPPPPPETAMGALVHHITGGAEAKTFQPMNVNFGLFPPVDLKGGRRNRPARYKAYTDRAKAAWRDWLQQTEPVPG